MEYWFIFLECSQRDFGQLTNDSFFSHFTQTDIPTSNKLEMNPRRVSGAPFTWTAVTVFHGMTVGIIISGMCRGKVHTYAKRLSIGEPGPSKRCWESLLESGHTSLPTLCQERQGSLWTSYRLSLQPAAGSLPLLSWVLHREPGLCYPSATPLRLLLAWTQRLMWGLCLHQPKP